jgi:hypothetical protein
VICLFLPAIEADEAAILLEADDAVNFGDGHRPDLEVAQAALGALKP